MQLNASIRRRSARRRSAGASRSTAARWRALSACCLLLSVLFYGAAPLATLWGAAHGIRSRDADALRAALDWRSVRDGLKQDLGNAPALSPSLASTGATPVDDLPAFGESFATTVVSHAIDDQVTPEKLVGMLSGPDAAPASGWRRALGRIVSIGFVGPTRFEAAVRMTDDAGAAPLLLSLRLQRWQWRITRIHLPDDGGTATVRTDRT